MQRVRERERWDRGNEETVGEIMRETIVTWERTREGVMYDKGASPSFRDCIYIKKQGEREGERGGERGEREG